MKRKIKLLKKDHCIKSVPIFRVILARILSKYLKMWARITPNTKAFHAVNENAMK